MEIKQRFVGLYRKEGLRITVVALDFKGSDIQRMGDLLPCTLCGLFYQKGGLVRHLREMHNLNEIQISQYLPKGFESAQHTYATPVIDWFLVDVIAYSRESKERFRFYCSSKEILNKITGCGTLKELQIVIRQEIYPLLDSKEFFEKFVEWKFKSYVGTKEEEAKMPTPSETLIIEGRSHEKVECLSSPDVPIPNLAHYFYELDRQIELLGLQDHRETLRQHLEKFINKKCKIRSYSMEEIVSAVIFHHQRGLAYPMTFNEFVHRTGANKRVFSAYKSVKQVLGQQHYSVLDYIAPMGETLGIPLETQAIMKEALTKLRDLGYLSGMTPISVIVGAWFYLEPEKPIAMLKYYDCTLSPTAVYTQYEKFQKIVIFAEQKDKFFSSIKTKPRQLSWWSMKGEELKNRPF